MVVLSMPQLRGHVAPVVEFPVRLVALVALVSELLRVALVVALVVVRPLFLHTVPVVLAACRVCFPLRAERPSVEVMQQHSRQRRGYPVYLGSQAAGALAAVRFPVVVVKVVLEDLRVEEEEEAAAHRRQTQVAPAALVVLV